MKETVPASQLSFYGTSVNFGIVLGVLMAMIVQGMVLPTDPKEMQTTTAWMIVFAAPIFISLSNIWMWKYYLKFEPIDFSIENEDEDEAEALLNCVYNYDHPQQSALALNKMKQEKESF
jgi:hypothetical protein